MGKIDDEIQTIAEGVAEKKTAVAMQNLALFMEAIRDGIEEFADADAKKVFYDKGLGKTISEAIEKAFTNLSKLPAPRVTVNSPQVNIDLSQLQSISSDISKGQNNLISLIEKINPNGKNDELVRLITALIGRQNVFLEKGMQQFDYRDKLQSISEGVNKKPIGYEVEVTQRDQHSQLLKKATIKPNQ